METHSIIQRTLIEWLLYTLPDTRGKAGNTTNEKFCPRAQKSMSQI